MNASAPDTTVRKYLLARRLRAFASATPLSALAALVSLAALLLIYQARLPQAVLGAWAAMGVALLAVRVLISRRLRPEADDLADLSRQWGLANCSLILSSAAWAASLPLAATIASDVELLAFAMVIAIMLGSVLLLDAPAPPAAIFHIVAMGAALGATAWFAAGPQAWPLLLPIAGYAAMLLVAARKQERVFHVAGLAQLRRRESEQALGMLLDAFEAPAAEWSWCVKRDGSLQNVSDRLAEQLGLTPQELEGEPFVALFAPGHERDRLAALLAGRSPFTDVPAPLVIDGERRTWRLSGQPREDGGMTGQGRDVTDRPELEERVRAMATLDPLTGLANRNQFNQRLRELLTPALAGAKPIALLYLDLDDFKAINDAHGHLFGDALLREMGARLRSESRGSDLVARLGGDEFAIIIEAPGGDGMLIEHAHRLLAAAREPFRIDGQLGRVTTSLGIARPSKRGDPGEFMRRADLALYAAKAKGRDQLAIFDEALDRRARERGSLELDLREAIAREELVLHYQPIIALQSGATVGYEALLRWRHPLHGLMPPERFLPIAEETGLILGLGDWVIHRALTDVAAWGGDFRLALNLSPGQIRNPQLTGTIDAALAASGIAPGRLELEITETALLEDASTSAAMLGRLRALGVEIVLDDFGTGYSSLSYLRRFRFDRVKIDRIFVRDIETSDESQAIVSAITRLAEALGMRTTAEGVELPGQLDMLRRLGCDEAQGFLILEPVEAERIEQARLHGGDEPELGEGIAGYREARRAARNEAGRRKGR
jgi:diguanylate cyclase (GGDEF)-like protein/PAS domain S-box-containing protein